MKFRIGTGELGKALFRVQGIADKKNSKPILAHALLRASADGLLEVSATDLDVGLTGIYNARVVTPGAVALQSRQLYDIVKSFPQTDMDIEAGQDHWVEIHAGNSRFRLPSMPAEEFPHMPVEERIPLFELPAATLLQMIDRTIVSVSLEDNRYNLSGVYCEGGAKNRFRMVSTDGHRLALVESVFSQSIPMSEGVIVPRKGFHELRRILSDLGDDVSSVQMGFSEINGVFKAGSVTVFTRLVDGKFPDYDKVIPKGSDKIAKIGRVAFMDALKRVSLVSRGHAHGVQLTFSDNTLELMAEDPEFGDAQEALPIEYRGARLAVGFNARYVLDVLALIPEQGILFELSDDLSPGIIRPLEENGFLGIVMPMRI